MSTDSAHRTIPGLLFVLVTASLVSNTSSNHCGSILEPGHRAFVDSLTDQARARLEKEQGVHAADICRMPEARLKQLLQELMWPGQSNPGDAQAFRRLQQLSSNKKFNTENWLRAHEQVRSMRQGIASAADLSSTSWESIGPGNIGGRIRSLAFDPDNSDRLYAGAVSGGVWLSENGGQSWLPRDDFMANLSVTTLIFDPSDSNVMYAGTGETIRGRGIFKSADKGASWSILGTTHDDANFNYVRRLAKLHNSTRLVAATSSGIWVTDDDGATWTLARAGSTQDIDMHPFDSEKLVAGTDGDALFSLDGGQSWDAATGLDIVGGRVEIAYSRSSPDIVYASVNHASGEVWRSTDGGQSFSLVNTGNAYMAFQGWYDNALWVDPTDASHIVVGGIELWRSTDGGITLTRMSSVAHVDQHFIIEHPAYDGIANKKLYFTTDGGVYAADDIELAQNNVSWHNLNNGLSVTQFYGVAVSPDGTVVGGTQDNGTLVYKGDSEGWTATFGGDGGFSATDPTDSNYIYGESQFLQVHRSTNGGFGSNVISDATITAGANFIAPIVLDPNDENRLFAGAHELWVSDDVKAAMPEWVSIKAATPDLVPISAIAVTPGNSDEIYVGHNDGSIYKTINGTSSAPTWHEIGAAEMPQRFLTRIAIDPHSSNILYVSFGGFNFDNLWKSIDGGASWNTAAGMAPTSIPPAPIRTIAIHPAESNQVYVGTEVGVFATEDAGATWSLSNDGPANVSVDELIWGGTRTLYAGTHGRGVFRATVRDIVAGGNQVPVLERVGNRQVATGKQLLIPLAASDADGDLLAFSDSGLPDFCETLVDNGNGTGHILCNPLAGDQGSYRFSVIVSDDGTPNLAADEVLTISVFQTSQSTFVLSRSFAGSGTPVALDGNTALVGSRFDLDPASALDVRNGSLLQTFDNPYPPGNSGESPDSYGTAVDLSLGKVLVGAQSEDLVATDSGAVYLFDAGGGALLRTFTHPNPAINQYFGRSIALHDSRALIGAFGFNGIFLFDVVSGNLVDTFVGNASEDSLALSDEFIVIANVVASNSAGAVQLYDATTRNLARTIPNPTPGNFDFFGEAVAIDGDRVLIGAGQVDANGVAESGEAYLFDADTGVLLHTFTDPTPSEWGFFGRHLDLDGDLLAISSEGDNEVHIFDATSGFRVQTLAERPQFGYGTSVDMDQGYLIVGAPHRAAFLYRLRRFVDVPPDYWAFSFIESLGASGITAGCGSNNYCPSDPVTRAQMAVFLERGMRGSKFSPPAAGGDVFLDVDASDFAASFIEQLFADRITSGCGNGNYCPHSTVTRDQMAVFLLRARHGAGYSPPPATGIFNDVAPGHWAVRWIEQLAAEGITAGCGGGNYCPQSPVTRDQMAVFLVRTFGL